VALTDKKATHIPYRESKLTRILSESLGGNSKTCLIITASPHPYNDAETLSTFRFGARARNIKNAPKVNREYSVAEMKILLAKAEERIKQLETKIKLLITQIKDLGGTVASDAELDQLQQDLKTQELNMQRARNLQNNLITAKSEPVLYEDSLNNSTPKATEEETTDVTLEAIQEKQDEIERLQDLLEKEKENLSHT
jgi:kinesin family protein 5